MDNVTEQIHQKELLMDQHFVSSFQQLNETKPNQNRAKAYCVSIENEAIAAIQRGNLPEVSFQVQRLDDVNRDTLKKNWANEDGFIIDLHRMQIGGIGHAPAEKRNYLLGQFLTKRWTVKERREYGLKN